MWKEVANQLKVPRRAAEAMHWFLGEEDMARRAGAVPVTLLLQDLSHHSTQQPHNRGPATSAGYEFEDRIRLPSISEFLGDNKFYHVHDVCSRGQGWPFEHYRSHQWL